MKNQQILLYKSHDGAVQIDVAVQHETVWLTQKSIAELFAVNRSAVTKHLKNIFESGELVENSVCSKMEHTATDGKVYTTQFYNLDAIIAIGYRVNSFQGYVKILWAINNSRNERSSPYSAIKSVVNGFRD